MKKNPDAAADAAALRRRAEGRLKERRCESVVPSANADVRKLLHELQVHQIELEMQNEELRQARADAEAALARYAELYDFAPVGYFTLATDGVIQQVNLAGAGLLNIERGKLTGRHFGHFIDSKDWSAFNALLARVFASADKEACELGLVSESPAPCFVRIEALADESGKTCRMALMNVTERRLAQEGLKESYKCLEKMTARLEMVREEEQKRIARELHDEMGAVLTALNINVFRLGQNIPAEMEQLQAESEHLAKLVTRGIQAMRQTVDKLRANLLDEVGLTQAIERHVRELQRNTGIECELRLPEEELTLDETRSTAIFRIIQESLTNTEKYARASKVSIVLSDLDDSLMLTIKDNGKGFDPNIQKAKAFGLIGIRERAAMVGGEADITSAPGKGTTVWVSLPKSS